MDTDSRAHAEAGSGISYESTEDGSVVTMWGDVDAALRGRASDTMAWVLEHPGPIVIDVSGVAFIDSSGLAFIVQLHMLGREEGFPVELRDPPESVAELLDMIGIGSQIPVVRSTGEAVGAG